MMRYPWANTILLILLIVQLLTGIGGLIAGSPEFSWMLWLHGVGGYAAGALLYWKGSIIFNVFKRRWRWSMSRLGFIILTLLLLAILTTGWLWSYLGPIYLSGMSLVTLHGLLACLLIGLLAWHTLVKWYVWRTPTAHNRRAFLYFGMLGLAGLTLRQLAEPTKAISGLPGAARRFTGAYETGSFSGTFPATNWFTDNPAPVDIETWQLRLDGLVETPLTFSYRDLLSLAEDIDTVLLDCTGGFYTTQEWRGIRLHRLLEMAGIKQPTQSITIEGITGYGRRFPLTLAQDCLLATHVADHPLTHGHGYPLRLVVSGRRGYDWVKWVAHIRLNETSHLWQPPLPLQ